MRFQDSILTGSSHPSRQQASVNQAYPGDASQLDQTYTGSIAAAPRRVGLLNRAGLTPRPQGNVGGGMAVASAPVANPYPAAPSGQVSGGAALAPVTRTSLDSTVTGSTSPAVAAVRQQPLPQPVRVETAQKLPTADGNGGWSRAGGTQVSIREGETVYNLSRRFGVPVDSILKANGMSNANQLAAGQQVVIPTYVHSAQAPVSAPDANPNVADARSSTGTRYDVPAGQVPVPGQAPGERLAVLPQQPKLKEGQAGAQTAASGGTQAGPASSGASYTVAAGDTLSGISRKTGVSTEALKQANGLSNGLIRIGQTLTIPPRGAAPTQAVAAAPQVDQTPTGTVKPEAAAYQPPRQAEKVIQQASLNDAQAPDATGISRMRWPVRGRVISNFGASGGKSNDGIDIAVPEGTPVKAAENGVVIYAGDGLKEFGNTVLVRHEDGLVTVYGHASQLKVERGQKVRRGEEIALAGMSGSAETPKLHFEVRKDSTPINPVSYLE